MATPKPGEIRCPTCHRSTPPAAFCTQCGSAIPTDARIRPRGMDRDELQERIRARRSGGEPYRRGGVPDEEATPYQRYEPEPADVAVQRGHPAEQRRRDHFNEQSGAAVRAPSQPESAPAPDRSDLTRDRDEWAAPVIAAAATAPTRHEPAAPPLAEPPPAAEPEPDYADAAASRYQEGYDDSYPDEAYEDYPYEYDQWEERPRPSGAGAFAILGFLALGVLALLGGAVLAGAFNDDGGVGVQSPTPIASGPSVAPAESAAPSLAPSTSAPSADASAPTSTGEPVVFPDGFMAEAQPCLPGSAGSDGCGSNGATNGGVLDIWVGFENGTSADVVGATIVAPDGTTVGEGTIPLADIGCRQSCNGWTYFNFRNLTPGTYEVRVTRNGEFASQTSFEVS